MRALTPTTIMPATRLCTTSGQVTTAPLSEASLGAHGPAGAPLQGLSPVAAVVAVFGPSIDILEAPASCLYTWGLDHSPAIGHLGLGIRLGFGAQDPFLSLGILGIRKILEANLEILVFRRMCATSP